MLSIALAERRRLRSVPAPPRPSSAPAGSPVRWCCCGWCWLIAWGKAACDRPRPGPALSGWLIFPLADISNVALLNRLRGCGDWLAALVGGLLAAAVPMASRGRLIRLIDATAVPKAGGRRPAGQRHLAGAQRLRPARRAFHRLRGERGDRWRAARPDRGRAR